MYKRYDLLATCLLGVRVNVGLCLFILLIITFKTYNKYMKYDELINKIKKFNADRDWDQFHSPDNLAKSIAIEAGELLECFQWNNEYNLENVTDEMADVFVYLLDLANKLDVDLLEITTKKIVKNAEKYPVDKSKGKSTKYDKL